MARKTTSRLRKLSGELNRLKSSGNVQNLAEVLFEHGSDEDLACMGPAELAQLAISSGKFLSVRTPGRAKVRVYNPEGPAEGLGGVTVVEAANDDMPFLVDSTVAVISDLGHDINLVLHPILHVARSDQGGLLRIDATPDVESGSIRESLLHIHISRIEDEAGRTALCEAICSVLDDIRMAVLDWRAMQLRVKDAAAAYQENPPPISVDDLTETMAFLQWLLDNHFTFVGVREFAFTGSAKSSELEPVENSGLGILRKTATHVMRRGQSMVTITPEIRAFLLQPAPVFITKSDLMSNVHRRVPMDYVGIKQYDDKGHLTGELRVVGLFTSTAYTRSPRDIPVIRRKIMHVVSRTGFDLESHSGKGLLNVLETFPRDELFQVDRDTLATIASGVHRLEERPRTRLFVRRDKFDRFVSAFVYISRDRFDSDVRRKVGARLAEAFGGEVTSFSPSFGEGSLVRVHFNITRKTDVSPKVDKAKLEAQIVDIVRTWDDRLAETVAASCGPRETRRILSKYQSAFSRAYQDAFTPEQSLHDIEVMEDMRPEEPVDVIFYQAPHDAANELRLKVYQYDAAIPLSDLLPILEKLGLRAIEENTYTLIRRGTEATRDVFIHEVELQTANTQPADVKALRTALADCFLAVWHGVAENDRYNTLVLREGFVWRDAALLRAFGQYLRQASGTFTPAYMADTLVKHAGIAKCLTEMFHTRFTPGDRSGPSRDKAVAKLTRSIDEVLRDVPSLNEDRIVRRFVNLIKSMLRTNFFKPMPDGSTPPTIAFKIDSRNIEELPEPRPFAEIFVYSPDFEGIHLRGGRIARGGLRWSDRPEDFRTEVLGLAKAQNVKNAVIVPVGAKGGFVPKKLPQGASREEIFAEGTRTYKLFVSTLLSLTDNLDGDTTIPPVDVIRYDDNDPYLVVAADKGTATFSDTANALAVDHGFWLDDAFASGGSAGYDHKVMGITARGGWEAVKRHFREMDFDIQTTPFTVVGVGDMSGDVFGNGMLLSRKIKLLAAFDHRDIFIDPTPDPAKSFAERKRLFALPRSSWNDYNAKLISTGGGIFSRQLKSIPLSQQMRNMTGLKGQATTPDQLINALLKSHADLMWFGGIGTYIRGSTESNADAGDRANDAIRVTPDQLNVKVIGEGANLGITQRARIEFALAGGRINTDAIDNSAGVNSSDIEVNIKIALSTAEADGKLLRPQRNKLLAEMTDEVAALVLRNNYLQTLCLTLSQARGRKEAEYLIRMMRALESEGALDRDLEALPHDEELMVRMESSQALTRPELSVLIAYAKIDLFDKLLASNVPDDPYYEARLLAYFPQRMARKYGSEIRGHKLRREIIATILANRVIDRGGPSFISRLIEETGHDAADIVRALTVAHDAFGFIELNSTVDALDNQISGEIQTGLYLELQRILRRVTIWFLRNETFAKDISAHVTRYAKGIETLRQELGTVLPQQSVERIKDRARSYVDTGVPKELADRLAGHRYLQRAPDIVQIAGQTSRPISMVGRTYFAAGIEFGIDRLMAQAAQIDPPTYYERLAVNRTIDGVFQTHRGLVVNIMASKSNGKDPWEIWQSSNQHAIERTKAGLDELLGERQFDLAKLALAAGQLGDLSAEGS